MKCYCSDHESAINSSAVALKLMICLHFDLNNLMDRAIFQIGDKTIAVMISASILSTKITARNVLFHNRLFFNFKLE
ncbi:hypothetical protein BK026_15610 [Alteromonas sp. V450]|nr:hypothetical protein BK026_15610 [Alteromonas sp. V450]